jgi:superfamily II DNA/RNA helicase
MPFSTFGLRKEIVRAVADCGYTEPTPIQAQAIPHILQARDVVGLAQTGTGKTAGFILPMLEILAGGRARARMPRSLVLTPTRELAAQVAENFDEYGKNLKLSKAILTGGSAMGDQMKLLDRGVDVLVATPGRLLDLFERGHILLSDIKILVIDEADRMLDMGFIPDIDRIISLIPRQRQTLLFSATMPPEIQKLAGKYMYDPVQVSVAPRSSAAETVEQYVIKTTARTKKQALAGILGKENIDKAFIFLNRKRDVASLSSWMESKGYMALPMHGDMAQKDRNRTLEKFKTGDVKYLVCSDVAARGLDVEAVPHVINYDVPINAEDYVHRIGRTGRAGMKGKAWTLACPDEDKFVKAINDLLGSSLDEYKPESKNVRESPPERKVKDRQKPADSGRKKSKKDTQDPVMGFGEDLPAFFTRSDRRSS